MLQSNDIASKKYLIFLVLLGIVFFLPFIGNAHLFDWDEINFAEIAREMYISKNYSQPQINFQLFTEKPPLFFWLQLLAMKCFGINEWSARFPNAILGVMVLPLLFSIGKKLKDHLFGLVWAIAYGCTILPHLYFKSGIIDPWFNFFIISALYGVLIAVEKRQQGVSNWKWLLMSGCMAGLSILTKGPAALLVMGITAFVFLVMQRGKGFLNIPQLLVFSCTVIVTVGTWFGFDYFKNGPQFIVEFTIRQWELFSSKDAGHGGFILYHVIVLFFGCFPIAPFFIQSLLNREQVNPSFDQFRKWMVILFWVVLVLFSIVQTKIVHYSSLCYYPISFLAAVTMYNVIEKKFELTKLTKMLIAISGFPFILAPFLVYYFSKNMYLLKVLLNKDAFAVENLQANVNWSGWEFLPGLVLLICIILFFAFLRKNRIIKALVFLFFGSVFFIQCGLILYINRVEAISQNANIEFWQQHASEDCYKTTFGYRSYTTYFYGAVMPQTNSNYTNQDWLLHGKIDKPLYISCKVTDKDLIRNEVPDAVFLYNKNGFYFYKRSVLP